MAPYTRRQERAQFGQSFLRGHGAGVLLADHREPSVALSGADVLNILAVWDGDAPYPVESDAEPPPVSRRVRSSDATGHVARTPP